jgi:gliding motility-associated-like protein
LGNSLAGFSIPFDNYIYQFDLTAAVIPPTKTLVGTIPAISSIEWIADMEIGPDDKIYFGRQSHTSLDIITNPNTIGVGCGVTFNAVSLGAGTFNLALPNTMYYLPAATPTIHTPDSWYCVGDNITELSSDIGDLWFNDAALSVQVGVDSFYIPPTIIGTTTYYVVDTTGGCYSLPDSVTVTFANCSYPCSNNILQNGDFENYSACPNNPSQMPNCDNWLHGQTTSSDYFNGNAACAFTGPASTSPPFTGPTSGLFANPSGTGFVGIAIQGTGPFPIGEGFGQQVTLSKCVEYTLQFRSCRDLSSVVIDNDLCVYGGNTALPIGSCGTGYTQLACIPAGSININWNLFTLTFTPTQNYDYLLILGSCPSTGSSAFAGYAYFDDMFLCANTCVNQATNILPVNLASDTCSNNTGSGSVSFTTNCYTGYDYVWLDGSLSTVSTDSVAVGLTAGTYTVEVTDSNGCMIDTTIIINALSSGAPSTTILSECDGFSITVNGNTYSTTGIYYDTIVAGGVNGCDSIITTDLTINSLPNIGTDTTVSLCYDDPIIDLFPLLGGADLGGTWSPALASGTGLFDPLLDPAGNYSYVINNGICPIDSSTVVVTINQGPIVSATIIDDNCLQDEGSIAISILTGIPPFTFDWDTGPTDSTLSNLNAGTYTVIVTDNTGCRSAYNYSIVDIQTNCDYHIYLPNVFSPNGDGENDVLYVRGKGVQTLSLSIYNRWGNKVFETDELEFGWDGTYRGEEQGSAMFVYYLSATFVNGETVEEKGNVSIVK